MENRKLPALLALAGIVIAVIVFFFVANDDTADQESEHDPVHGDVFPVVERETREPKKDKPQKREQPSCPSSVEIKDGAPVGGVQEVEVITGDEIRITSTDRCSRRGPPPRVRRLSGRRAGGERLVSSTPTSRA